jgi:hypothetical protein
MEQPAWNRYRHGMAWNMLSFFDPLSKSNLTQKNVDSNQTMEHFDRFELKT